MNKNLSLDNIQVYGFDYDYTLAHYSANLQSLIYDLAKEHLVNEVRLCIIAFFIYHAKAGFLIAYDLFGSFSSDILNLAWSSSTIPLFRLEAFTMINSKVAS